MPSKADMLSKMASQVRTGGKGSVRRKRKVIHKSNAADDQRLQNSLQRLGLNTISAIEEANLFHEDGTITHFVNPQVMASQEANCIAISGKAEKKQMQDLLPGIINQLGMENLGRLAQQMAKKEEEEKKEEAPKEEEKKEEEKKEEAPKEEEKKEEAPKEEEKKEESK